jgi:hypothetical protein
MSNTNSDLDDLLNEPREALDIEIKDWLDLSSNDHRSLVAKEIIALANHGGGFLIIGYSENSDGTFTPNARASDADIWSQDNVQSIISKYVDPSIQCRVHHRPDRNSGGMYPIISVPGGHRVPIRAKSGSPDGKSLVPNRIYLRRPGPSSEEPKTTDEWDRFFERCLQNRRSELLNAMRDILAGVVPSSNPPTPTRSDELDEFVQRARERWEQRVRPLPTAAPPRMIHGCYDISFAIEGEFTQTSIKELRDVIQNSVRNHSGRPPFLTVMRHTYQPQAVDGAVECWIGSREDGTFDTPDRHDFWRASPNGLLFTRRGYSEDGRFRGMEPGSSFDITTMTWRLGEAILEAKYIFDALNASQSDMICKAKWSGLKGRHLVSVGNPNRPFWSRNHTSAQDTYELSKRISISSIPNSLPEFVFSILHPLYELFEFFDLPKRLVEEELAELTRR